METELPDGRDAPVVEGSPEEGGKSVLIGSGGSRVETGPLLPGLEEEAHPIPNKAHKSFVVLGSGWSVPTRLLLTGRGCIETAGDDWAGLVLLLVGPDEGGQPIPNKEHKSPLVLGEALVVEGGRLVCEGGGSLLTGVEDGGHPTPNKTHKSPVVLGEALLVEGGWLVCEGGGSLLTGVEDGHPIPNKTHKSPVVLGEALVVEGGWLVTGGGFEAVSLLLAEEEGQPIPSKTHRSPDVLEGVLGGWLVWEGGELLVVGVEDEGQPMPDKTHKSPVVVGGVSVDEGG